MNKQAKGKGLIVFLILVLIAFLIWGYLGGQEALKVGMTCDMGFGDNFCWKWHTNIVGQVQEGLEDTGNAIRDFFGG